jgi:cobaltochelatase CobT
MRGPNLRNSAPAVIRAIAARNRIPPIDAVVAATPAEECEVHGCEARRAVSRGHIDAFAFRARYSDERLHASGAPRGARASELFFTLEQCRVEALAARDFPGAALNLSAFAARNAVMSAHAQTLVDQVLHAIRQRIGAPVGLSAANDLLDHALHDAIENLALWVHSQTRFATSARQLIAALLPRLTQSEEEQSTRSESPEGTAEDSGRSGDGGHLEILRAVTGIPAPTRFTLPLIRGDISPYSVYTREFDWTGPASEICTPVQLNDYRRTLDQHVAQRARDVHRWAHRLQRRLMSRCMSRWQFDVEEGLLDCARLQRIVLHPTEPLSFKQEAPAEFPETAVSILVDNSGSMRGAPIATAAVCADVLGSVLDRCGVKCEILGFTTRAWRGGRARERWSASGRAEKPGRLTELRHIVYKDMDAPWRRARRSLGAMLHPDLLKENVDGEALLWAHERLIRRPEQRRILIVISDGAPLDDATLATNDAEYLERHLGQVIAWLGRSSAVELHAIGIAHDVTAYYPRAVTISDSDELGKALFTRLAELLDSRW